MSRVVADIMATDLVCFTPDTDIHKAIHTLLKKHLSGAPVVDKKGVLVGVLSKKDCLKVVFTSAYHQDRGGPVSDYMTHDVQTLDAELDVVATAQHFLETPYRRFPVLRDGELVGQVSRHDVLKALAEEL